MDTAQWVPMHIGGSDAAGMAPPQIRENPAQTDQIAGGVECANAAQAHEAMEAAASAASTWAGLSLAERVEHMRQAWEFTTAERNELAQTLTRELGKMIADTNGELAYGIAYANYVAENAANVLSETLIRDEQGTFCLRQVPYGVVVAIIPWNAPLNIASTVVAPALIAGNTVVVKPSPLAPIAVTRYLHRIAHRLPPGVVNIVNGDAEVGEVLTTHPLAGKIAFTGSTEVGRVILRGAAEWITPSLLELGGNDAALVLEDMPLTDEVVARLIFASFLTAGQVCMAIKRLFVHQARLDELIERYRRVANEVLVLGDPLDEKATLGPMVSDRQRAFVRDLVKESVRQGAEAVEIGVVQEGFDPTHGYYLQPTLVTGAAPDNVLVQQEQFGPTVPLLPFATVEEGVQLVNESPYGLCASVWSADPGQALTDVAPQLDVGTVFLNTHNRSGMSLRAPFGGRKLSGYGREYGLAGIAEFCQTQSISYLASTERAAGMSAGRRYQV